MRRRVALCAAFVGLGAICAPVAAQDAQPPLVEKSPLCVMHGDGCSAPPSEWMWLRQTPAVGGFSVELPCDQRQVDAFAYVMSVSRAKFPATNTRPCFKSAAGFSATLIGVKDATGDTPPASIAHMLGNQPDMFTAFTAQGVGKGIAETTYMGRRAIANTIDKPDRRSRVVLVEAGRYAVILLTADIDSTFPGTREEGDAAAERFLQSLEIAE
jgi:hypothetical protein